MIKFSIAVPGAATIGDWASVIARAHGASGTRGVVKHGDSLGGMNTPDKEKLLLTVLVLVRQFWWGWQLDSKIVLLDESALMCVLLSVLLI